MKARVGDQLWIESGSAEQHRREGEVVEVRGADGDPPFVVHWSDGHDALYFPGPDAHVHPRARGDGTES